MKKLVTGIGVDVKEGAVSKALSGDHTTSGIACSRAVSCACAAEHQQR